MSNWIKTVDALPEYGTRVLLLVQGKVVDIGELCIDGEYEVNYWANKFGDWDWECSDITHWMPLPELPEEGDK